MEVLLSRLRHEDAMTRPLTPRQLTIVSLMAESKNHPEIARDLGISAQTVKNHMTDAFRRLGIEATGAPGHRAVALYASGQLGQSADS
jgi:DNA-binding NarL/FixJ family response regulator